MAKGQKRSGREAKKPKATKKPGAVAGSPIQPAPRPLPTKGGK